MKNEIERSELTSSHQVWGFEELQGKRYYSRHVVVRKKDDWKQARLVYDWQEPANLDDEDWEEIPSAGI